jgi:GxxExxY protein
MEEGALLGISRSVIGAAIEVHQTLGPGMSEGVYQDALEIELGLRGVAYQSQVRVPVGYKGRPVGVYVLDLLVMDSLVVELKAVDHLAAVHHAQALAYLRATKLTLALLINFNVAALRHGLRRVISSRSK